MPGSDRVEVYELVPRKRGIRSRQRPAGSSRRLASWIIGEVDR